MDKLTEQLERLYKIEVNVILYSDWDNHWSVGLGNHMNPSRSMQTGLTLEEVVEWLSKQYGG